jgi:enoyl-CoA hydratase
MRDASENVVLTEQRTPGVVQVTINRASRKNALNLQVKERLAGVLIQLERDPAVRVVVLTGAGDCFVAGTDLGELVDMTPTEHALLSTDQIFKIMLRYPKPLIAAVEGYALGGGCELALACDMIVAGESAKFGLPEIRVGVMPGAGGSQRLLRTIGKYLTMRMILTGEMICAKDGFAMGFLSDVTADGEALARAIELAEKIAAMPPLSVRAIKEVMQVGGDASLETALMLERRAFQVLFDSHDQSEGMSAFLEKRPPSFSGK